MTALNSATGELDADHQFITALRSRRRSNLQRPLILLTADGIAACVATYLVHRWAILAYPRAAPLVLALAPTWILLLFIFRSYDRYAPGALVWQARRVFQCAVAPAIAGSLLLLSVRSTHLIAPMVYALGVAGTTTVLLRAVAGVGIRAVRADISERRTLIAGRAEPASWLVAALERDHAHELRVVGACLVDLGSTDQKPLTVPVLGDITTVVTTAASVSCDMVVVTPCPELDGIQLRRLIWSLHDVDIDVLVAPPLAEVAPARIMLRSAADRPLLQVRAPVLSGPQQTVKAVLDRVGALLLLIVAAPIMAGVAIAVRVTSPGPALFRQRRLGRYGKEFTCLKFRTMDVDADARRHEVAHLNERSDGPLFKIRKDPRTTSIGGWLRRSSLDELPQLFNVLAGDMSLVGPRPPLPSEVARYDADARRRLLVKPGITGLWQVSGRSELPWTEAVRLDLAYVDNWSPMLDLRILLRTTTAVIRGTGAY